jgi:hypothetical protein
MGEQIHTQSPGRVETACGIFTHVECVWAEKNSQLIIEEKK